jgi:hypothetical protein
VRECAHTTRCTWIPGTCKEINRVKSDNLIGRTVGHRYGIKLANRDLLWSGARGAIRYSCYGNPFVRISALIQIQRSLVPREEPIRRI